MKNLQLNSENAMPILKALANEHRMKILTMLNKGPLNVNEISERLHLPFSTTAVNVKKLEDAGLITTEMIPGRGSQKISSSRYDRISIELKNDLPAPNDSIIIEMPIGEYVNCEVAPTCGLLSEDEILGLHDDPRSFYEPIHKQAQLLWFRSGHVEYRFPNRIPYGALSTAFEISAELCSEAPYSKLDWPSDITLWINDVELGTWTSPSDFGGQRGFLTPTWWETHNTQYGLLKRWRITDQGCYIDGTKISDTTIDVLKLSSKPYISVKFGVKEDAVNKGGMNLFGKRFGNYEQDIIMKVQYVKKDVE
ncbi:putative transcriptional regulator [Pullulanibacillus pueri]|uniref:Transcriptional regulator n=1 Tax=Pullulanibacillus pueri TaxID=1437324 RepID=A0A8J2ZXU7_9BACL|nr:helix-turn-helix domain-containing protein [Pullulanibacillus pueri]MBM7682891.1 putative transcriptional regulator [Pullulanibacillus pueri]GGH84404.1 transcriptional regulator [Pullulanibacillus pueri]